MFIFRKGNRVRVVSSGDSGYTIKGNRISIRLKTWAEVENLLKDWDSV